MVKTTCDLTAIIRSLLPDGETLLWIGESDGQRMRQRNRRMFAIYLLSLPLVIAATVLIVGLGVWLLALLSGTTFDWLAELVVLIVLIPLSLAPLLISVLIAAQFFVHGRFVTRPIMFGICENYILVAYGPGTFHQRICRRGSFQQMRTTPHEDDLASFVLVSSKKNVPSLELQYVRPANELASLLANQLEPVG